MLQLQATTLTAGDCGLLRFMTCGSVDDGKSTLLGRLLHDSGVVFEDHIAALEKDSRKHGTTGNDVDLALLLDGLQAEREQGITIDVGYRYFATQRRSFIAADAPGHEQYTRNMATAAANSDFAIILVDARKGVLPQTKRHSYICALLGIRHVLLAVNKIDLVGYSSDAFDRIVSEYREFAGRLAFGSVVEIPISARYGDNVTDISARTSWYCGPTLLEHLETIQVEDDRVNAPFRFLVQWVNRRDQGFRGLAGIVSSGSIGTGDETIVALSGRKTRVAHILTPGGEATEAITGDAVTLTLTDDIDVARGDILTRPQERPVVADQFAAHLIWMSDEPLLPGRSYQMRIGNQWVPASVTAIKHRVDVNTLDHHAARKLALNEIGFCNLAVATPVAIDRYKDMRATGAFILVDRYSNNTLAAGMIDFELRRATNIHRESLLVDSRTRAASKHQRPVILWFTGLSGAGKSTIAKRVEKALHERGCHTYLLDGDNLRHGLNRDLGFTDADRVENIRRVGEVAKLFIDAGLIVLCSFISPFRAERDTIRNLVGDGEFVEIFVDAPIEVCMQRDPKGLYAKARAGTLKNFTGVDSPYEAPLAPELRLDTAHATEEGCAEAVVEYVLRQGYFS